MVVGAFAKTLRVLRPRAANPPTMNWKIAIYLRVSKEDDLEGQSESIQNQRDFLTKYVLEQGWNIVDVYIDDGFNGLNLCNVRLRNRALLRIYALNGVTCYVNHFLAYAASVRRWSFAAINASYIAAMYFNLARTAYTV